MTACTTAVAHAYISCYATGDTDYLNNISYLFQQLILSLPTTYPVFSNNKKRVNNYLMTLLLDSGNMVKLVKSNIKNVRKLVSLLVF